MVIKAEFENEAGLNEYRKKHDQLQYAFSLIFKTVKTNTVKGASKNRAFNAVKKIFKSQLVTSPKSLILVSYTVDGENQ